MKIALIRKKYAPYGGAELYITNLIASFKSKDEDHEVHLFANEWPYKEGLGFIFHKVPVLRLGSFFKALSFAIICHYMLKKKQFDIIHSFDRTLFQDIYRAGDGCHITWLTEKTKDYNWIKKILVWTNPLHILLLYIEKRIYNKSNTIKVIANSYKVKREIIEHYNYPGDSISVIYNGVDIDRFTPQNRGHFRTIIRNEFGVKDDEILLLFVGSGFERKGLRLLLEGLYYFQNTMIDNNNIFFKLIIIGKGNIRPFLEFAKSNNLIERLIFLSIVSKIELFYAAGDIFVLPTLYDPFSNACLEAMASGLPVITTKANGGSELIQHKFNGIILDNPNDPKDIASSIEYLIDPAIRKGIGENARKTAEYYTIKYNMTTTLKAYKEVINIKMMASK